MPGEWMDLEGGRAAGSVGEAVGPAGRLPTRRDSLARAPASFSAAAAAWALPSRLLAQPVAERPSAAGPPALQRRPLQFPRDFGAHPEARTEWWYVTGWLAPAGSTAPSHGFQLTFFRRRTDLAEGNPSAFAARQLLLAHAALTDLAGRRLRHDQRVARSGSSTARTMSAMLVSHASRARRYPPPGPRRLLTRPRRRRRAKSCSR